MEVPPRCFWREFKIAGRESTTPLFSFDTPPRDRSFTGNIRNSTARDIVRSVVESGTPTTTTAAATELTPPSIATSTTVFTPNTTQVQSRSVATSSRHTSMNEVSW